MKIITVRQVISLWLPEWIHTRKWHQELLMLQTKQHLISLEDINRSLYVTKNILRCFLDTKWMKPIYLTALASFVNHFLFGHSILFHTGDCALALSPICLMRRAVSFIVKEYRISTSNSFFWKCAQLANRRDKWRRTSPVKAWLNKNKSL